LVWLFLVWVFSTPVDARKPLPQLAFSLRFRGLHVKVHVQVEVEREAEKVLVDPGVDVEAVAVLVVEHTVELPVDSELAVVEHIDRSVGDERAGGDGLPDIDVVDSGSLLVDEDARLVAGDVVVVELEVEQLAVFVAGKYVLRVGVRAEVVQEAKRHDACARGGMQAYVWRLVCP